MQHIIPLTIPVLLTSFPIYQDPGVEESAAIPFSHAMEEAALLLLLRESQLRPKSQAAENTSWIGKKQSM